MSVNQTFNGVVYPIPTQGDLKWAAPMDRYLIALGTYALSPAGGSFPLTANVDFGTNFGLITKYVTSESNGAATAGMFRLAHNDIMAWRNAAGSGNLNLTTNGSDQLTFNGSVLNTLAIPVTVANGGTGLTSTTAYAVLVGGTTSTSNLQTPGTGSSGQVLTSQGPGSLPIWSAAGTGSGTVNIGTANQLAYYASSTNTVTGLTAITASRTLVSDTNGLPVASGVTATTLAFLDATSSVQTQLNAKATDSLVVHLAGSEAVTGVKTFSAGAGAITLSGSTIAMGSGKITGQANGTAATDSAAFGQIQQLAASVQTHGSSATSTTSTSPVTTNTTAAISPSSSSSRVKVTVTGTCYIASGSTTMFVSLFRNAANLATINNGVFAFGVPGNTGAAPYCLVYIDSPATTSSTSYTIFIASSNGASVSWCAGPGADWNIILEEIR